jgi:hypothetical protein
LCHKVAIRSDVAVRASVTQRHCQFEQVSKAARIVFDGVAGDEIVVDEILIDYRTTVWSRPGPTEMYVAGALASSSTWRT